MARGDECKTTSKANHACKNLEVSDPIKKKTLATQTSYQQVKKPEQKNYGAWGPLYKDKKTFTDMHIC